MLKCHKPIDRTRLKSAQMCQLCIALIEIVHRATYDFGISMMYYPMNGRNPHPSLKWVTGGGKMEPIH
jgi:hypothetical protein